MQRRETSREFIRRITHAIVNDDLDALDSLRSIARLDGFGA